MDESVKSTGNLLNSKQVNPFLWHTGVNEKKIRLLERWVLGNQVVDVGCGNGIYAQYLSQAGSFVTALDPEDRVIDKNGLKFLQAAVPPIPLPDNFCNTLILFDVLEHVEAENNLLAEIKRVTTDRLILSVPADNDSILPLYGLCLVHHVDKTHRREYNPDSLKVLLERHGFQITYIEAQYPDNLPLVIGPFFSKNFVGKLLQRMTLIWLRLLMRLKIIQVDVPGDWFIVADVVSE